MGGDRLQVRAVDRRDGMPASGVEEGERVTRNRKSTRQVVWAAIRCAQPQLRSPIHMRQPSWPTPRHSVNSPPLPATHQATAASQKLVARILKKRACCTTGVSSGMTEMEMLIHTPAMVPVPAAQK